ncbi:hypothetical protein FA13DRAFT_1785689 [Coprinellus micaceus]|uniref:Uncharacterized protein n=1 Tax=Coprinellus micaceus TaxID=71717 RepID=A0A4Y7TUE9_COPMI|nr:hypothetical protein FA13DRAFT_1785689 [Coprinellus micaceus]
MTGQDRAKSVHDLNEPVKQEETITFEPLKDPESQPDAKVETKDHSPEVQMLMEKNQELRIANAHLKAEVTELTERAQVKTHTDEECQTILDLRNALNVAVANAEYARSQTAALYTKFEAELHKRVKKMQPSYDSKLMEKDIELALLAQRNHQLEERVKELEAQLNGSGVL